MTRPVIHGVNLHENKSMNGIKAERKNQPFIYLFCGGLG